MIEGHFTLQLQFLNIFLMTFVESATEIGHLTVLCVKPRKIFVI